LTNCLAQLRGCSKLTSNISHHDWHDWISPTIGYIALPRAAHRARLNTLLIAKPANQTEILDKI
jgi:hypothetical protein